MVATIMSSMELIATYSTVGDIHWRLEHTLRSNAADVFTFTRGSYLQGTA